MNSPQHVFFMRVSDEILWGSQGVAVTWFPWWPGHREGSWWPWSQEIGVIWSWNNSSLKGLYLLSMTGKVWHNKTKFPFYQCLSALIKFIHYLFCYPYSCDLRTFFGMDVWCPSCKLFPFTALSLSPCSWLPVYVTGWQPLYLRFKEEKGYFRLYCSSKSFWQKTFNY